MMTTTMIQMLHHRSRALVVAQTIRVVGRRPLINTKFVAATAMVSTRTMIAAARRGGSEVRIPTRPPWVVAFGSSLSTSKATAISIGATLKSTLGTNRSFSGVISRPNPPQLTYQPSTNPWASRPSRKGQWNKYQSFSSKSSGGGNDSDSSSNSDPTTTNTSTSSTSGSVNVGEENGTTTTPSSDQDANQDGASSGDTTKSADTATTSNSSSIPDPTNPVESESDVESTPQPPPKLVPGDEHSLEGSWYLAGRSVIRDKVDDDDDDDDDVGLTRSARKQAKLNKLVKDPSKFTVRVPVKMPDMDEHDHQSRLVKWYKQVGDVVQFGDLLCDIETQDFTFGMETEDECLGIMGEILVPENSPPIHCGQVICVLLHEPPDENKKKTNKKPQPEEITITEVLESLKKGDVGTR